CASASTPACIPRTFRITTRWRNLSRKSGVSRRAAQQSSAAMTTRNGRRCARAPTPMSDAVHARPKIIGARVKRTEDPRLLTGRGSFVDDRQVNALQVAFRRSEHAHARILSIDYAAARAAPGVIAVFTVDDLAVNPLVA